MDRGFQVVAHTKKGPARLPADRIRLCGPRRSVWGVCVVAALALCTSEAVCRADTFLLKQGGSIDGTLANPDEVPRQNYVVQTEAGATVTLPRTQVAKIVRVRPALAEYEKIRSRYPDTVEGQWELAEWCNQQSLAPQRRTHLARVVELDPEHVAARRALGYSKVAGKWETTDEHQTRQGLIRYKGKWITPQEKELLEEKKEGSTTEREWIQKVKLWVSWLPTDRGRVAEENLMGIRDPAAVKALSKALDSTRDRQTLSLLIRAISKIDTAEAAHTLASCSMLDPDEDIRIACLDVLKLRKSQDLLDYYVRYLGHRSNPMVNRAGTALKEMEDPSTVEPLIKALVTVHKFKVAQGNSNTMNPAFGKSSSGSGGGMGMGSKPPVVVSQPMQNQSVLEALVKITKVNYGFDLPAWRNWFLAQKKPGPVDGRRG